MVQEPFNLIDPVTVAKAANQLSISRWTVYRWIRHGKLHAIRFGGILFITTDQIDRILNDKES